MTKVVIDDDPAVTWTAALILLGRALLGHIVSQCCVDFLGVGPVRIEEEPAPEHERAGHG